MSLNIFIHKNIVLEITIFTMFKYLLKFINHKKCDPWTNNDVPGGV